MAYCGKHFDKADYRTYCLMGDGESMEGNVWEAMTFAGFYKLDNLCAIIDVNRLGQSDPAPLQHDMETYKARVESFGFHGIVVDGHNIEELVKAFDEVCIRCDFFYVFLLQMIKFFVFYLYLGRFYQGQADMHLGQDL